jgi:hypothetical protein
MWPSGPAAGRLGRGLAVVALSLAYVAYVFRRADGTFFTVGLGDWMDPYFINALLENWYRSLAHFAAPAPPWFFPSNRVLGYSHSLVLFAPFYVPGRLVLHPIAAYNVAICAVLVAGSIGLYALIRRVTAATFVEALLVTAFFATSTNVVSGGTGVWTQRASVFLIPLILLVAVRGAAMAEGSRRNAVGLIAGLLALLVFTHDFYTGYLAFLVAALLTPGVFWSCGQRGLVTARDIWRRHRPYSVAVAAGAVVGAAIFLALHWKVYRANRGFPEDQLNDRLFSVRTTDWHSATDVLYGLIAYETPRPLWLVLLAVLVLLGWRRGVGPSERRLAIWLVLTSIVVFAIPVVWRDFSLWKAVFVWIPGARAIRDPARIVLLYELAIALVIAVLVGRLPPRSVPRVLITSAVFLLLLTHWNHTAFDFGRPISDFERWVSAPIAVDRSCQSFFVKVASQAYMSRSGHMGTLYGVDAMFIAMVRGVPTLNGYAAVAPGDWHLANPHEDTYLQNVSDLIGLRGLSNVCVLDIDARTMVPYVP